MQEQDQTFTTYNSHTESYLSKFSANGARIKDIDETFSYLEKTSPTILELGCAGGRDASYILTKTTNYTGIDYIPAFIDRAQQENPLGTFVCAKMQDFSFPENIDVVFAFASLLHLSKENLANVFAKAHRALSHSGLFRISLKASDNYKEELVSDQYGERLFFFYNEATLLSATSSYKTIFLRREEHAGVLWIEALFQKEN